MTERVRRELQADTLGRGQSTRQEEQEVRHTDMERSLEREWVGLGCCQIPSGSEDPSFAPLDHHGHCNRHVLRRVRRRRRRRRCTEPVRVAGEEPTAGRQPGKAGRRSAGERAGIGVGHHTAAVADRSGGHSWGGSFGPATGREARLVAGVAGHVRGATGAPAEAAGHSLAGREERSRAPGSEGRMQAAGRRRSPDGAADEVDAVGAAGAAGGSRHDRGHPDLCRRDRHEEDRTRKRDTRSQRLPVPAEGPAEEDRSCTTWFGGRDDAFTVFTVKPAVLGQMEPWAWSTCQKQLRARQPID